MSNRKNSPAATPSVISKGCVIKGIIESDVFMRIDGYIKGDLFVGQGIIIGDDGLIDGNIETKDIVVHGTVNGKVKAQSIEIKSSGKILGGIETQILQVEKGAVYTGSVSMNGGSASQEAVLAAVK